MFQLPLSPLSLSAASPTPGPVACITPPNTVSDYTDTSDYPNSQFVHFLIHYFTFFFHPGIEVVSESLFTWPKANSRTQYIPSVPLHHPRWLTFQASLPTEKLRRTSNHITHSPKTSNWTLTQHPPPDSEVTTVVGGSSPIGYQNCSCSLLPPPS